VCGSTTSTNFPTANAAQIQIARGGGRDGFVLKLNPAGNALAYSSYFGGSGTDILYGCTVDSYGQLYAVGETNSANITTKFPFQAVNAGGYDAMLLKVNMNSALVFSTYFGGSADDGGRGIALHGTQLTPYVTGFTWSTNFPVLNPAQLLNGGGQEGFARLTATPMVDFDFAGGAMEQRPCRPRFGDRRDYLEHVCRHVTFPAISALLPYRKHEP
jgi:hypothetical protein